MLHPWNQKTQYSNHKERIGLPSTLLCLADKLAIQRLAKKSSKRYDSACRFYRGGVAERFKAAVLKTAVGVTLP